MKISFNFSSKDFDQPALERAGIAAAAYPGKWVQSRLAPLCMALEVIRAHYKGRPLRILPGGGYRSPEYEQACGGDERNPHCLGVAADIVVEGISPDDLLVKIMQLREQGQIEVAGLGRYRHLVHLDQREVPAGTPLVFWQQRGNLPLLRQDSRETICIMCHRPHSACTCYDIETEGR
jgi:hypothetical protein